MSRPRAAGTPGSRPKTAANRAGCESASAFPASAGMEEETSQLLGAWAENVPDGSGVDVRRSDRGLGVRVGSGSFAVVLGAMPAEVGYARAVVIPLRSAGGRMLGALLVGADGLLDVRRSVLQEVLAPLEALAMNTAGSDIFSLFGQTGDMYGVGRVGSGRVQVHSALASSSIAYNADDSGSVSVSFGAVEVAGTATAKVIDKKPSSNSTAYYIVVDGRPVPLLQKLYNLYYKMDTLVDSVTLLSQRGSLYSEEGGDHKLGSHRRQHAIRLLVILLQNLVCLTRTFQSCLAHSAGVYLKSVVLQHPRGRMPE